MTIIIETPQPPVRERLMRVPDGAVRVVKGDVFDPVDRLYVKEDAEVRDATPADMERAGWVPRSALDTQVEATLSNIRRAGHLERERDEARCLYEAAHCERMRITDVLQRVERERDEARDTIARARGCITDVPAGVRNALDVEVARVVRERDEAVRSRDQARAALAAWQGSAEQERARIVRDAWVAWAHEQPSPRPGWLVPWDEMPEGPDKEVDRRIGDAVAERLLGEVTP